MIGEESKLADSYVSHQDVPLVDSKRGPRD
jgi:hypothetical protein